MEDLQITDQQLEEYYFGVQMFNCILQPTNDVGGLYLGRVHVLSKIQDLKDKKIGAILSIIDTPVELNPKDGFTHLYVNMEDEPNKDLSQHFQKTFDFLEENLAKTNVYVHCQMGISRSSTIVIAYLMRKNKQRFLNTLKFVQSMRSCVEPNTGFKEQLKKYEQKLFKDEKK